MQEPAEECLCIQMWWSLLLLTESSHIPRHMISLALAWQSNGQRDKAGQCALDKGQWGRERWAERLMNMRMGEARFLACGAHTFHFHPFAYLERSTEPVWGFPPFCNHCLSASFTPEGAIDEGHRQIWSRKNEKANDLIKEKGHQLSCFWDEEQNLYHG